MALVWRHTRGDYTYEVRSHGASRRLYTNGVFHSQYNPRRPVAGSVWDLLLLPAFLQRPGSVQRVLVLGVGGGAVIRQLQHFLAPPVIVGVELNPVHIDIARRFFGLERESVPLYQADAIAWLQQYRGEPFDLIIEDLFFDRDGEPCRAVAADADWCHCLLRNLREDGALVMNFDSHRAMKANAFLTDDSRLKKAAHWDSGWKFSTPLYDNAVAAFTRQAGGRPAFDQRLLEFAELDRRRSACALNFRMRRLF